MALIKKQSIANYSKLSGDKAGEQYASNYEQLIDPDTGDILGYTNKNTGETVSSEQYEQGLTDAVTNADPTSSVTTPPSNYNNTLTDRNETVKKQNDARQTNQSDTIQNKSKALSQELPKLDEQKVKQLSFTPQISKLRDCMVFVLYSPSSNENPNLSNSQGSVNRKIGEATVSAVKTVGQTVNNFSTGIKTIDDAKKDVIKSAEDMAKGKELTANEVEKLNKTFYTDESDSKTDKKLTIFLPLPKQITDQHSHEMDGFSNNPIQLAAGLVVSGLNSLTGGPPGNGGGTSKIIAPGVADYIMNNLKLAGRKTFNPSVETLYRSPQLRNWQWTFEYSPTSKDEANEFISLVNKLKEHSYPTQDVGGILYTFPGTVDFYFRINGEESKVLPRSLQKCFIKGVQIDYTQQGFYSHFKDGNPVTIVLTLDISETRLLNRSDLESVSQQQNA